MVRKRIIPCLDIKDGRTVKGVNFVDLQDAGDPVALGAAYAKMGADELTFLDITATVENRKTFAELVEKIALHVDIPFTVGGGIQSTDDVKRLLDSGADKITINSYAVAHAEVIEQVATRFGAQCMVLAVDSRWNQAGGFHEVYVHGGRTPTGIDTLQWVQQAENLGTGEILLTSMDHDGTKAGFALELTAAVAERVGVPVIASGGGGTKKHFYDVFVEGKADAALAASIFHFGEVEISAIKSYIAAKGIAVRQG